MINLQARRVFITQVNSYFGAALADYLLNQGCQVAGFVDESSENSVYFDLLNIPGRIALTFGRLSEANSVSAALESSLSEVIIHLGVLGSLSSSKVNPQKIFTESVESTVGILENLRNTGTIRGLIYISSDKVYRSTNDQGQYHNQSLTETAALAASDFTTTARLLAENILDSYRLNVFPSEKFHLHKIRLVTLRLGGGFGAGDLSEGSLIHQICRSLLFQEALVVKNPSSLRSWTYLQDQFLGIAQAMSLILEGKKLNFAYNLSSPGQSSVADIVRILEKISGKVANSNIPSTPLASVSRHREQNSELATQELLWSPAFSLEKALQETFKWYKEFYSARKSDIL